LTVLQVNILGTSRHCLASAGKIVDIMSSMRVITTSRAFFEPPGIFQVA
jgi:hypothetical protein